MKTVIQIEIEHSKPLPENLTDAIEDRAYQFVHAKGGFAGEVVARIIPVLPVKEMRDE